jgi:hypothetical protein
MAYLFVKRQGYLAKELLTKFLQHHRSKGVA